jgi:hypothetical protein
MPITIHPDVSGRPRKSQSIILVGRLLTSTLQTC